MSIRQRVALQISVVMAGAFVLLTAAATWTTLAAARDASAGERAALVGPALDRWARDRDLVQPAAAGAFCLALHAARDDGTCTASRFVDAIGRPAFAEGVVPVALLDGPGAPPRVRPDEGTYEADVRLAGDALPRGRIGLRFALPAPPPVGAIVRQVLATHGVVLLLGTLLLVGSTYLLLDRVVLRPLDGLAAASRRIAKGDYLTPVPVPAAADEISELIRAFNQMTAEVRGYHVELERRVAEATDRVKATERKIVLAQRLAAMGTLAAGIAHEVNNPIGGMINAARRLHEDVPAGKPRTYVELIVDGLQRVEQTVRKVLQFTPRRVTPEALDLRTTARRALDLARYRLDQHEVLFEDHLPEDLPPIVGEASELQQVFLNLFINAADATPKGGRVTLTGRRGERGVEVDVTDTGSGMDEETLARCFDLFYTTKEQGEGTGLGLAIVHHIVHAHGGTIEIESAKGRGTTVHLRFPFPDDKTASRRLTAADPGTSPGTA